MKQSHAEALKVQAAVDTAQAMQDFGARLTGIEKLLVKICADVKEVKEAQAKAADATPPKKDKKAEAKQADVVKAEVEPANAVKDEAKQAEPPQPETA